MGGGINRNFTVTKLDYKIVVKGKLSDMGISSDAAQDIVDFYFSKSQNNSDALFRTYTELFGDLHLGCPTLLMAENVLEENEVYAYHSSYKTSIDATGVCPKHRGVCHGDDVIPLFGLALLSPQIYTDTDRDEARNMITIWTDFAKTDKAHFPVHFKTRSGLVIPYNKEINFSKGNPTRSDFNYVACRVLEEAIYSINPKLQD